LLCEKKPCTAIALHVLLPHVGTPLIDEGLEQSTNAASLV